MVLAKVGFRLSALVLAMTFAQGAWAHDGEVHEEAGQDEGKLATLAPVQVKATRDGASEKTKAYGIKRSASATKLNLSVKETPQTVNVVTRQQMDDFGLTNVRAVLAATPGVIVQSQETDRTSYSSRGTEISNFQVDGLGVPFDGYNYQNGDIDTAIYDRIEVVKGANGLNSGLGDPGASVNFVRKRPTKDVQASGGITYGSWNTRRIDGDVSGALNASGSVRGRLVVAGQDGDSYLDNYAKKKYTISGVLEADLTDSTLLTIGDFEQKNKPSGNNWGALPLLGQDGKQLSYARDYNPVPTWSRWDRRTNNSFVELKQKLLGDWALTATYNYVRSDEQSKLNYYFGAPDAAGHGVSLYAAAYFDHTVQQLADVNAKGTFALWGQRHEAVVGAGWSQSQVRQGSAVPSSGPSFNWNTWDGQYAQPSFTPDSSAANTADYSQKIKSLYTATRLHLSDDLRLLLGVNYTQATSAGNNYGVDARYDRAKAMPYAGVSYNINPTYTAYASYSTIFRPQSGLDTKGNLIPPVDGKAIEAGVKGSWLNERLTGSVAIFDTLQNNFPLRASDSASLVKLYEVGDLRTRGFELSLLGRITDQINLSLGYSQVRLTNNETGDKTRTYLPSRTFNSLLTYQFASIPALKIGAGLNWLDKVHQDIEGTVYQANGTVTPYAGTIRQKGYALLNLMASYDVNKNVALQLNVDNATNTKYLNSFPDGQGYFGAPVNYTLGVKFKY
jgi:outer membrane receptor for ferric coprogen and ferric-rhodotorulic acid